MTPLIWLGRTWDHDWHIDILTQVFVIVWHREQEDGAKVVRVENLNNPYSNQHNFDKRFKLTLNKLYAWSLVDYDRVVMLDADNLFLRNADELFQCGQFCAAFINPCIFHTGLFVLQVNPKPSSINVWNVYETILSHLVLTYYFKVSHWTLEWDPQDFRLWFE